jgi:hypothetical protein
MFFSCFPRSAYCLLFSSPPGNRTPIRWLKDSDPAFRRAGQLSAGREALESSSPRLQRGATPSQLSTRKKEKAGHPRVTPGLARESSVPLASQAQSISGKTLHPQTQGEPGLFRFPHIRTARFVHVSLLWEPSSARYTQQTRLPQDGSQKSGKNFARFRLPEATYVLWASARSCPTCGREGKDSHCRAENTIHGVTPQSTLPPVSGNARTRSHKATYLLWTLVCPNATCAEG